MIDKNIINILISGVGGQGTLLASEITAITFARADYDVKMSAVSGLSQRGGSVCSHIRIGEKIHSPIISKGKADILIAMELSEASSWLPYLKRYGLIILLDKQILSREDRKHADYLKHKVRKRYGRVLEISYDEIYKDSGNMKTANIFILGVLSNYFSVRKECWLKTVKEKIPFQMRGLNLAAFESGRRKFRDNEHLIYRKLER